MTNADKYLKDGVDVEELIADLANYIRIHNTDTRSYLDILHSYFDKPVKPTLTEDEKAILRNIHESYEYIGRIEETNRLYICEQPKMGYYQFFNGFHFMFKFIKPRRRI